MPELRSYLKHEVPRDIAIQIRSFVRIQWPQVDPERTSLVSAPPPAGQAPVDRIAFVLVEGEVLISHAEANVRTLEHRGQTFRVGGLSTVLTYPAHRGQGCGEQVVRAATEHLLRSDAVISLLFCGDLAKPLYERVGWTALPTARILYGDPASPNPPRTNHVMALFAADNGGDARGVFESEAVYVGPNTW